MTDCSWLTFKKIGIINIAIAVCAVCDLKPASATDVTTQNTRSEIAGSEQITSVHQLSDVRKNHWSVRALKLLADRHSCLENSEWFDRQVLTRYEFAAALNICIDAIDRQVAANENSLTERELKSLVRLQQDFATELTAIRGKVGNLAARIGQLEEQKFSTTTKFRAEVLFQIGDSFSQSDRTQTFFGYRSRLDFDTSFTGEDLLRVRLAAKDIGELDDVEDTVMVRLGTDGESDSESEVEISYEFPLGDRANFVIGTTGVGTNDVAEVLNPFSSSGRGAVSRFGRRNPATLRTPSGAGGGIQYELSDAVEVSLGYFVSTEDAADSEGGRGLFGGSYSAVAQLLVEPIDDFEFALTYTRSYFRADEARVMGATGSENANEPFGEDATSADNFGFQVNWELSDGIELGGWFGYSEANREANELGATILNGALTLAFSDLLGEGNLGGIIIGVPPTVAQHDNPEMEDEATSLHIEALYRILIDDQIEITPGIFLITKPDHSDRDSIWVGTIRTRFSF